ncbi:FKBP-type peptidyl-prolyl cis-trans isomerase [Microbacterium terricola]|uniref:peptidylprolyl isomerase n=1 Tax=Microbacterium terricola TaxID=344163 RepID=A0ABM8DWY1_9MICO|nr:FKBP-type peptidyl-prolyl cis-trans isomerase [Microbacterium terricola]UYK39111.1 FKBP-type peptidyl-prolyl cis-trans isomerase [Microbacterium terricola]BDV30178.1 peptidylprolyl isomerase [Microbacterium terricola]
MRIRPLVALSAVAVTALLLAGCSSSGDPEASPTPSSTDSECLLDAQPGADSDAITVAGEAPELDATVPADLGFEDIQRTIVSEGDGDELHVGDLVSGAYEFYDGASGKRLETSVDTSADESGLVPILLDASAYSVFVAALECAPLGSTAAITIPGSAFGEGGSSVALVAQGVEKLPTQATGEDVAPTDGMPTVTLAEDGAPTIELPGGDAPTKTEVAQLKKGDGAVVKEGDTVFVQYTGVKWSDGTVFDSSWERGAPTAFPTTGVVAGFKQALEGQAVGSQVIAVIPPADGYGEGEINEDDLVGETLVFVVDILGTQRAVTQ